MKELEVLRKLGENIEGDFGVGVVEKLIAWVENNPELVFQGGIAFVLTLLPANRWIKEAARDGKVTTNEKIGIAARSAAMAAGTVMVEGAMINDPITAISEISLLGAELKLGYDLVEVLKNGALIPRGGIKSREYWVNLLKVGAKAVGFFAVIPNLGVAIFSVKPVESGTAAVGAGLVMAANFDLMAQILGGATVNRNRIINNKNYGQSTRD